MKNFLIAPSILSADFARLGENIKEVISAGGDVIHFDVMDNHYVPNLTLGPMVLQSLRNYGIITPIDVHLMAKPVDRLILNFAIAGANYITFHPESSLHIEHSLQLIKDNGCKAGLAFNPTTSLCYLEHLLEKIDLVLIMSVNPGFSGQSFIPLTLHKLHCAYQIIKLSGKNIRLEVDGGVKIENIRNIAAAGADIFVIGSSLFNQSNYRSVINIMRKEIKKAFNIYK